MKKLATLLCMSALATGAFAQGTVAFLNGSYALISTNSGSGAFSTGTAASGYYYGLFTASSTVTTATLSDLLTATWTFTGAYATNIPAAGRLSGGANVVTTTGWTPGNTNSFLVAGWNGTMGHDWATIASELSGGTAPAGSLIGLSAVGFGAAGGGTGGLPAFALWATVPNGQGTPLSSGFTLSPVPEPTTLALSGLGAAALLIFRRRK